ncbi:MAG: tyrosine-protein kinase family protein [Marinosulfonomonas sp.]
MERLEAALEKARQSRRTIQMETDAVAVAEPVAEPPKPETVWSSLKEIKISNMVARNHRITALSNTKQSGPYDLLRSRTLKLMRDNNWSTLAVTSPNAGCGKTTVCANLAISLARQSDFRILLLDLDLRRPALNKVLAHKPSENFHSVLEGKVSAEQQLVRFGDNLAIGLNNKPAHNPSELLQSKKTQQRLEEIRETFKPDFVIIDMPPMLATDDNVGFLPSVDCGLLVSAADSTTVAQLDICEKELSELTNVLGVVLNKCRYADEDHGYDYDYY